MKSILFIFFTTFFTYFNQDLGSTFNLGPISFKVVDSGKSNRLYIWLHGDEKTAEMALDFHIKKNKGKALYIQSNERVFRINGNRIDPNRIFSRDGARNSLNKYNINLSSKTINNILDQIDLGRIKFLNEFLPDSNALVIALHNNSRGYTIKSEIENSLKYSIKSNQKIQDFYICTSLDDYKLLEKSPFNVVLLNDNIKDDGSLSFLMKKMNVRYVNVEVKLGWLSQQKKMMKYIEENLP